MTDAAAQSIFTTAVNKAQSVNQHPMSTDVEDRLNDWELMRNNEEPVHALLREAASVIHDLRAERDALRKALREVLDWTEPKQTTRMQLYRLNVFSRARRLLSPERSSSTAADPDTILWDRTVADGLPDD